MEINVVKLKQYASEFSVLYVEDDDVIQSQTKDFLARFFPKITTADDGEAGLELYKNGHYDIVITDINMPKMNGIEMIEAILDINPNQVILVTSAHNDSESLLKLINLNVMHFVLKPFNNKQFIIMLYAVTEELHNKLKKKELEQKAITQAAQSQAIVDMMDNGVVIIDNNEVTLANNAFLRISGFEDFETLQLEMPDISILFQSLETGITAMSNQELIQKLLETEKSEHKLFIDDNGDMKEYQVTMTQIPNSTTYILVFTDFTAIYKALYTDTHTQLPTKHAVLQTIEAQKQSVNSMHALLLNVKNFENVLKWYGKNDAFDIEKETASLLKSVCEKYVCKDFIGYFGQNQFFALIAPEKYESVKYHLENAQFSHNAESSNKRRADVDFNLSVRTTLFEIDCNKNQQEIEIDLINAYDALSF